MIVIPAISGSMPTTNPVFVSPNAKRSEMDVNKEHATQMVNANNTGVSNNVIPLSVHPKQRTRRRVG